MRIHRIIRPARNKGLPKHVVILDADGVWETDEVSPNTQVERLAGWCGVGMSGKDGRYKITAGKSGLDADELWRELDPLLQSGHTVWVFSESACRVWTLLGLWDAVEEGWVKLTGSDHRSNGHKPTGRGSSPSSYVVLADPPTIIDCRRPGLPGKIKIVDVANYGMVPTKAPSLAAARVVRALDFVSNMLAVLHDEGMGGLCATAGSQAMQTWRYCHLDTLVQCHTDAVALSLEDAAYYGGRCEAFMVGELPTPIVHLDVSAMYPSVAVDSCLPLVLMGKQDNPPIDGLWEQVASHSVIADVTVETDEPAYPYHHHELGITIWPTGRFRTVLAGPELADAISLGYVCAVHRMQWYGFGPGLASYCASILYMRNHYRDNADVLSWIKSLGVAIVGKLGQRDRRWEDEWTPMYHHPWDRWTYHDSEGKEQEWRSIAGIAQREVVEGWGRDAVPAVAAWITSAARVKLLNMIRWAQWANVYYCDTDSLLVNPTGFLRLAKAGFIRAAEPGYLRIKEVCDRVDVHGIKSYEADGVITRAGMPATNGDGSIAGRSCWITPRASGYCRERRIPRSRRVMVPHEMKSEYRHGTVLPGGRVMPHVLWEMEE